jgi:CRISPR/Cas system-associated exonuclease Cas4 (RecB family)
MTTRSLRVCVSASAAERIAAARDAVRSSPPGTRVLIVGASRGAADDLARSIAASLPATFGIERVSLTQLAARTAVVSLAADGMTPSSRLGAEAVAARAVFDAVRDGSLRYFEPVAGTPGFPRALARTLQELRLAAVEGRRLDAIPLGARDLADLLARFDVCFERASTADRAVLFATAARLARARPIAESIVLLDLVLDHGAEREFVDALVDGAASALATVPHGDRDLVAYFERRDAAIDVRPPTGDGDLACLRRFLFATEGQPPDRILDGSLEFFSAPGEGREAVEIARRILREAARGVPFDEIAVLVRSPQGYFGLLEHALKRAGVPGWFDRGTRRPHPAGRAFLALLACAAEQLSAARFAEYLSLGQVPQPGEEQDGSWVPSQDEALARDAGLEHDEADLEQRRAADEAPRDDAPVTGGTLRAPWRWESFLVEAAVIGQGPERWRRRLDGKAREIGRQIAEVRRADGGDDAQLRGLELKLEQLDYLRAFALPIVDELAGWPNEATWGGWLERFEALAPRVLRMPAHVLRVLADLRPMSDVGPVDLDEARRVLGERLLTVESAPPARRFGRVFVGTPQQARGRAFRVVFVPGLAERMFPQKPREDPLLLDPQRAAIDASLPTQRTRLGAERLLLQLAAGAASERLYVSYPRLELSESRARVPSFYALDVMRAATGRVPDYEALEERARQVGSASLAWPAPATPEEAIDDQEHDLAVLRRLLDDHDPEAVRGHAHYLLKLNESLRRSVINRWARGDRRWSANDGLTRVSLYTGPALAAQRLTARSYSLTALQRFAACPYQFLLSGVYRLQPMQQPEPLQRMDPLTRGSIFHDIQARFFRAMLAGAALPVTNGNLDQARATLNGVVNAVAEAARQELAPAVERVWDDEVGSIRRDLHAWLEYLAADGAEWEPKLFEYAFGSVPGERDPSSRKEPVTLEGGFRLRGAIDLVEEHRQTKALRVTDHKTGRRPDRIDKVIIGGGAVLQPVLYAMAVEAALGRTVAEGRLFYCTSAGGFYPHRIPLNERTRQAGLEVLQVVDRAVERGFLAASPAAEACDRCDFRAVCGPDVFARVRRKPQEPLADLLALRTRP